MKIYTKSGDEGDTSLFGGARVRKDEARVAAYGGLDELNAVLGLARSQLDAAHPLQEEIESVQSVLFGIGGEIATVTESARGKLRGLVGAGDTEALERSIDAMEERLEPLKTFILPGGSPAGAVLHVARTVCRRAERRVVALGEGAARPEVLRYVNRLSDWLFVAARSVNQGAEVPETPW